MKIIGRNLIIGFFSFIIINLIEMLEVFRECVE